MLELNTAETVIDHGLSLGADFAEVFVERSLTSAVNTLSSPVSYTHLTLPTILRV